MTKRAEKDADLLERLGVEETVDCYETEEELEEGEELFALSAAEPLLRLTHQPRAAPPQFGAPDPVHAGTRL